MKVILVVALLCAFVIAGEPEHYGAPPNPAGGPPGRFQLASGAYWAGHEEGKTILRIDTSTGKTWMLIGVPVDDTKMSVSGWVEVEENPIERAEIVGLKVKKARESK